MQQGNLSSTSSIFKGPAIILAGGLGTRLRSVVPDLPKCMAPIHGRPFIAYVTDYLIAQGITQFIFALGYKCEAFDTFLNTLPNDIHYQLSIEENPLGTGGAIQLACSKTENEELLVTNGDTLFKVDVQQLFNFHLQTKAACTLSLKPMNFFERYGVVETNAQALVQSFKEKQFYANGLINGGVYMLKKTKFLQHPFSNKFSFEKDYLEKYVGEANMFGWIEDEYFIDIGIPEDYERAQSELQKL